VVAITLPNQRKQIYEINFHLFYSFDSEAMHVGAWPSRLITTNEIISGNFNYSDFATKSSHTRESWIMKTEKQNNGNSNLPIQQRSLIIDCMTTNVA